MIEHLEDGKILISVTATEKIGLPNYSNVDIGPITAQRVINDPGSDDRDAFKQQVKAQEHLLAEVVEEVVAERRSQVLDNIRKFSAADGYKV